MNKLTKLGLTALAGSLAVTSANAGSYSASGSASMGLTSVSGSQASYDANAVTSGNGWSMGNSVTFSGSGTMDNGITVSVSYELDNDVMDDFSVSLGLGEAGGTLTFHGSGGAGGLSAYDDVMPTAYAEVWDNTDDDDNGVVGTMKSTNNVVYSNSVGDIGISAEWSKNAAGDLGSDSSAAVSYTHLTLPTNREV